MIQFILDSIYLWLIIYSMILLVLSITETYEWLKNRIIPSLWISLLVGFLINYLIK